MNTRRLAVVTVAVFAAIGFAAAGCGGSTSGGNAGASTGASAGAKVSPTPTLAPKDALVASTTQLQKTSYKFTMSAAGLSGTGATEAASAKTASMSVSGTEEGVSIKMDFILINTDAYIKMDMGQLNAQLGIAANKWMHLDASKLSSDAGLPIGDTGDPTDVTGLFAGLNDVKTTDGKNFTGTIDMTKATGSSTPDADLLDKVGAKAKAVPFTASVDDQGRLTSMKIDGSGIDPQLNVSMTFSDYGSPSNVTKPDASQIVEAPSAVQQMFAGN